MGGHPVSVGGRVDAAEFRDGLLGRLGLTGGASDQDVETAHGELVEFLELAPHEVRSWAAGRAADVDEAFVLLSGPAEELAAAAARTGTAAADRPAGPSGTPEPSVTRAAVLAAFRPRPSRWWWAGLPLVLAAVVFGVFSLGGGSAVPGATDAAGTSSGQPSAAASESAAGGPAPVPVDKAKVAVLTKKAGADPKDVASLVALGDLYFAAADYKTAARWEEKVLAIDPKHQGALLSLGAARFNAGDKAAAKKHWLAAAALYPDLAEVHYDLGFLYMSQTPPDMAKVRAEWTRVVEIDPDSAIAKTVATHLKGLDSPAPGASATPDPK